MRKAFHNGSPYARVGPQDFLQSRAVGCTVTAPSLARQLTCDISSNPLRLSLTANRWPSRRRRAARIAKTGRRFVCCAYRRAEHCAGPRVLVVHVIFLGHRLIALSVDILPERNFVYARSGNMAV